MTRITNHIATAYLIGSLALASAPAFALGYGQPSGSSVHATNKKANLGQPLSQLSDAKSKISAAFVDDASGTDIGLVKTVQTSPDGKIDSVTVALDSNNKMAKIPAEDLRFDSATNTLNATLSQSRIDKMAM